VFPVVRDGLCAIHLRDLEHIPIIRRYETAREEPKEVSNFLDPEQKQKAVEAFKNGASIVHAAKAAGIAKKTALNIRNEIKDQLPKNCACGRENGHRGWCSGRLKESPARQETLNRLHRGGGHAGTDRRIRRTVEALLEKLRAEKAEIEKNIAACEIVVKLSSELRGKDVTQ
jgi:hypothetical protein